MTDVRTPILLQRGSALLRRNTGRWRDPDDMRAVADILVALRLRCTLDGHPDYTGRSGEYRRLVRDMYDQSGFDATERRRLQVRLAMDVGDVLAEILPDDVQAELGKSPESPRVRKNRHQVAAGSIGKALLRAEVEGSAGADPVRLAGNALALLHMVRNSALPTAQADRAALHTVARQLEGVAHDIRTATAQRGT